MSWTLYLEAEPLCPHCGRGCGEREIGNITWNVSPMVEYVWQKIGCDLRGVDREPGNDDNAWKRLSGHNLADVIGHIVAAYAWWRENEAELEPMNPPNGWGSTKCLERIYKAFIEAYDDGCRGKVRLS